MGLMRHDFGMTVDGFVEAAVSERVACAGVFGITEGWRMPTALWHAPPSFNPWTARTDLLTLAFKRHGQPGAPARRGDGAEPGHHVRARARAAAVHRGGERDGADGAVSLGHAYLDPGDLRSLSQEALGREVDLREDVALAPNPVLERSLNDYLDRAMDAVETPSAIEMDARAILISLRLLRDHGTPAAAPSRRGGLAPWQLRRVRNHVAEHLARDIPLAELSALVRLSPYHFCRGFSRSMGLPPHRWIQARRIEHAKALLARQEGTVLEVAAAVGYDNPGHFAKVFRKLVGVAPREYRRSL
jgi:AraC-like DNA-binding protein